ncbi:MAG TPA: glycosyltransferase [Sphingomicrobium sp.]|nr:glycosyltransferase [Sphingomicrobium sp.]
MAKVDACVTVIVTCFNLERFIAESIQSVLDQNFRGSIELIVVDDCSTDKSVEIIRQFPEARYLNTAENSGVLLATIAGIEAASNDLLFFLDGDDLWAPEKVQSVFDRFRADPLLAFATHDLWYANEGGEVLDRETRPAQCLTPVPQAGMSEALRQGILNQTDYVWLGSAMAIRASVANAAGFCAWAKKLPDPRNTYQDWPLAFWVAADPDSRLDYVADKLFRYRLHGMNYSGDAGTAAKAARNIRRSLNTALAMKEIADLQQLSPALIRQLHSRANFYGYLAALYVGDRRSAWVGFMRSLKFLRQRRMLVKEISRFAGIQLLGPDRFARLSGRRHFFRRLRQA